MNNPFFKNKGPFKIDKLLKLSGIKSFTSYKNIKIHDIKDLSSSGINDITFFHSKKYSTLASKTKASFCITKNSLRDYLPKTCKKILQEFLFLYLKLINLTSHFLETPKVTIFLIPNFCNICCNKE